MSRGGNNDTTIFFLQITSVKLGVITYLTNGFGNVVLVSEVSLQKKLNKVEAIQAHEMNQGVIDYSLDEFTLNVSKGRVQIMNCKSNVFFRV